MQLVVPIAEWSPPNKKTAPSVGNNQGTKGSVAAKSSSKSQRRSIFASHDGASTSDAGVRDRDCVAIVPYPGWGDVPTVQWQRGQLTNLCYLAMLNSAAGRTGGDHANVPIFPWVTDFSREIPVGVAETASACDDNTDPGWRDLSRTKYRLRKGDKQLDQTYLDLGHHVPEGLCELTYTVYRARSLPLDHLRATVRRNFVAAHYPASVKLLYDWTPDEATIEFYTSHGQAPCIFRSLHSDMGDLAVPTWCDGSAAFVAYHRRLLESEHVSRRLHLWIDLNFGAALAGTRAVAKKNVVLSSVLWANGGRRGQCEGTCHGSPPDGRPRIELVPTPSRSQFVQLFLDPHPKRQSDPEPTVPSALRTAFDPHREEEPIAATIECECADHLARKQRDLSSVGAILKECYISARVVPPPAIDEVIDKLLDGTLNLQQLLQDPAGNEFPRQLKHAYRVLSNLQTSSFQRKPSDASSTDQQCDASQSTELEQVWKLIQNYRCLESLSSSSVGLILPTLLSPLESIAPFIENCFGAYYPSFADQLSTYLAVLCKKVVSGMLLVVSLSNALYNV